MGVPAIWRYPGKAMLGELLGAVEIGLGGRADGRGWIALGWTAASGLPTEAAMRGRTVASPPPAPTDSFPLAEHCRDLHRLAIGIRREG